MNKWMLVLSMIVVLGFSGLANAKGTHAKAYKGTITAVNGNTFTITTSVSKKNPNATPATYTVDSSSATVTGGTIAVGIKVSVKGTMSGDKITATTIKIGKHKKNAA